MKKFFIFWIFIQLWMTAGGFIMNKLMTEETGETLENFKVYESDSTINFITKSIGLIFWPIVIVGYKIGDLFFIIRKKFSK